MSSLVNTYAKGRFVEKCMLPLGTDAVLVLLLQSTGLPSDTTMVNYQNLGAMLVSGQAQEATFDNYSRMPLSSSSISITHNTSSNPTSVSVSFSDQTWEGAGGAVNNTISKVVLAYQPVYDISGVNSTPDSGCLILATQDYTRTTTGGEFIVTLGSITDA